MHRTGRASSLSSPTSRPRAWSVPSPQSGSELREAARPSGHMPGPAMQSCKEPTQLANVFELLALRAGGACCPDGAGWLAGLQVLAGFHRGASDRTHSRPSGNKAHLLHWEFPAIRMEGLIGFIFSSCFSLHWCSTVFVKGVLFEKPKSLCPCLGHS